MARKTSLAVAVGAVLLAGVLVTRQWRGGDSAALGERPASTPEPASRLAPGAATPTESSVPVTQHAAANARIAELYSLSETIRNTTFVTAIRAAGFVCHGLETVVGGRNDSTTWTVACYDMHAYTIGVDANGALVVRPTVQYWDSIGPSLPPQR